MDESQTTLEEICKINNYNLPPEIAEFVADPKNLSILKLTKEWVGKEIPPEEMGEIFSAFYRAMKASKQ